jgi:hypothetical protein
MERITKSSTASERVFANFRLISIASIAAPNGSGGNDWFMYRIAQGDNMVTGYRRGSRDSATVEVERIVEGLNERLLGKGRRYSSASRQRKPPTRHKDLV